MPQQLALIIGILLIVWLYARDRKLRPMTSWALWIPLSWILIVGSRSVSIWFGNQFNPETTPADYLDGSPLDRNVFLVLLIAGLISLLRRRVDWGKIFASNRLLFLFFLYCLISCVWALYPFVSFKRWIKDIGNVVMLLIILTEKEPVEALKALFSRYTYCVIPLSVVFIKYFPELGRIYNRWTWEYSYVGVTQDKNGLGAIALVCGLFLIWELQEMRTTYGRKTDKADLLVRAMLLSMVFWLMIVAHSSTALACFILGSSLLFILRRPRFRRQIRHLGTYSVILVILLIILYAVPGMLETVVELLGRNMTFTGRTDIWADVLSQHINPIFGTGYQSFWLGPYAEIMWAKYYFHPNQAHNGYIETYLNLGIIGLCLLMAMIVTVGRKIQAEVLQGNTLGYLRFSFFAVMIIYNWTEAVFNTLSIVWIITLIAAINYPYSGQSRYPSMTTEREQQTQLNFKKGLSNT